MHVRYTTALLLKYLIFSMRSNSIMSHIDLILHLGHLWQSKQFIHVEIM